MPTSDRSISDKIHSVVLDTLASISTGKMFDEFVQEDHEKARQRDHETQIERHHQPAAGKQKPFEARLRPFAMVNVPCESNQQVARHQNVTARSRAAMTR